MPRYREEPELVLGGGGKVGCVLMLLGPLGVAVGAGCTQTPASSSEPLGQDVEDGPWESPGRAAAASVNPLVIVHVLIKSATEAAASAQRSAVRVARRPELLAGPTAAIPAVPRSAPAPPALARVTSPTGFATQLRT